ncbi:MAG: hypothetical protein M9894_07885 [Planctomycetes bacterium]|nr:hypothetical protein [Planctomycetota bacterium]
MGRRRRRADGDHPFAARSDYDLRRLVPDVLRLLDADAPLLARMETLRRATIYSSWRQAGSELGGALRRALEARALERDATGAPERLRAVAWFDAGYLAECQRHLGVKASGYGWMLRARELGLRGPELELACAIVTFMGDVGGAHERHLRAAAPRRRDPRGRAAPGARGPGGLARGPGLELVTLSRAEPRSLAALSPRM